MEKAKYQGSAGGLLGLHAGGLVPYTSGSDSLLMLQRRQLTPLMEFVTKEKSQDPSLASLSFCTQKHKIQLFLYRWFSWKYYLHINSAVLRILISFFLVLLTSRQQVA